MKKLSQTEFVSRSNTSHNNKYDYSLVKYKNQREKVWIICPIHGNFLQSPVHHMRGIGCNECAKEYRHGLRRSNVDEFIKKSTEIHGHIYDYSKVVYINQRTKVLIIDKQYGEFYQSPHEHLAGKGNPVRGKYNASLKTRTTNDEFVKKAQVIHGDRYDYSGVDYINCRTEVKINCNKHGIFEQTPISHLYGSHGCPKCGNQESNIEEHIKTFLIKNNIDFKERDRTIIKPYELDFYLKKFKLAIEVNGIIWHSEKFNKDKYYHLNKIKRCEEKGIRLLHFFEDEIKNNFEYVKNTILQVINNYESFTDNELILDRCIYNTPPDGYKLKTTIDIDYMYTKGHSRITKEEYNLLEKKKGWYKIWDCGKLVCEKV